MRPVHVAALVAFVCLSTVPSAASAQSRFLSFERGIDRPGSDFSNTPSNSAVDCSFACQASNRCRAFTFVRPGIQGPSGRCFLKTSIAGAQQNDCCTSGKRKNATRTDD